MMMINENDRNILKVQVRYKYNGKRFAPSAEVPNNFDHYR